MPKIKLPPKAIARMLAIAFLILNLLQTSCGEHICVPYAIGAILVAGGLLPLTYGMLTYIAGIVGLLVFIIFPTKKVSSFVLSTSYILLLIPAVEYYKYFSQYKLWTLSPIYCIIFILYSVIGCVVVIFSFSFRKQAH